MVKKPLESDWKIFRKRVPEWRETLTRVETRGRFGILGHGTRLLHLFWADPHEQGRQDHTGIRCQYDRPGQRRCRQVERVMDADRILPALFYQMFGDPATNPKHWPTGCLGDLIIELRYGTSVKCQAEAPGLPVLRIPNVIEGLFHTLLHRAFTGDLSAKWREVHMKELLAEMEHQARMLETMNHRKNTKDKAL